MGMTVRARRATKAHLLLRGAGATTIRTFVADQLAHLSRDRVDFSLRWGLISDHSPGLKKGRFSEKRPRKRSVRSQETGTDNS